MCAVSRRCGILRIRWNLLNNLKKLETPSATFMADGGFWDRIRVLSHTHHLKKKRVAKHEPNQKKRTKDKGPLM